MSLFDIIRYPIDINFRLEDLERIPCNILDEWWRELVEYRKKDQVGWNKSWMTFRGETTQSKHSYMENISADDWKEHALQALQRRLKENDLSA
jgi:hypothetical protein